MGPGATAGARWEEGQCCSGGRALGGGLWFLPLPWRAGCPASAAAGRPRRAGGEGCASWGLSEPVKGLCAQPHTGKSRKPPGGEGTQCPLSEKGTAWGWLAGAGPPWLTGLRLTGRVATPPGRSPAQPIHLRCLRAAQVRALRTSLCATEAGNSPPPPWGPSALPDPPHTHLSALPGAACGKWRDG